jgi:hypothetical protein
MSKEEILSVINQLADAYKGSRKDFNLIEEAIKELEKLLKEEKE